MVVLGGGGHAKVVVATARAAGLQVLAAYDDDPQKWGTKILDVAVKGPLAEFLAAPGSPAVCAIGHNDTRRTLVERGRAADVEWVSIVHPSAVVDGSVTVREGAVVFAGAIVQPDSVIGTHAIVNTAASLDHDCVLESYVHVGPGVHVAGGVRIHEGAFLGVGAAVIPCKSIGAWSQVGAGGVVIRDVPEGDVVVGVPAHSSKASKRAQDE